MKEFMICLRLAVVYIAAFVLGGYVVLALAAPEDEYRAGARAYNEGDVVGAMSLLKKAADAGHAPAQALLGYILDKAEFNEEAVAYFRKAAGQDDVDGEFGLGTMYASGEGVKHDLDEARRWITKAAQKGHSQAINVLAQAYIKSELGLDEGSRNSEQALFWIRRAADNNYVQAIEYLAKGYRSGTSGLALDVKQAEILEARLRAIRGDDDSKKEKKARTKN